MPRPETPIDPAGPLAEFANGLRALRSQSRLGYRELSEKANYSTAVLSQAASGRTLPTWEATRAFIRACGGDEKSWRVQYDAAARRWHQQRGSTRAPSRKRRRSTPTRDSEDSIERAPAIITSLTKMRTTDIPQQQLTRSEAGDPKDRFVQRVLRLRGAVGSPSLSTLTKYEDVPPSTMSDFMRGRFSRTPRWELTSAFVSACVRYGQERKISLPPDMASIDSWRRHHTELSLFLEGAKWSEPPTIRVVIAENMNLLRSALVSLVSAEEDVEVVADLPVSHQVLSVAMKRRPDVVVVSADADDRALSTVQELRKHLPECQIVALTSVHPAGLLKRLLAADVSGLVNKNAPADRLLHAIRGVAQGGTVIDASLVIAALSAGRNPFTSRELSVLQLAAEGASGPEIARQLSLSPGTVRNYLSNAMNKTGARTRIDAVRVATESGWL